MLCSESSFGKEGQARVSGLFPCLAQSSEDPSCPRTSGLQTPSLPFSPTGLLPHPLLLYPLGGGALGGIQRRPETTLSPPWAWPAPSLHLVGRGGIPRTAL